METIAFWVNAFISKTFYRISDVLADLAFAFRKRAVRAEDKARQRRLF